MRIPIAAVDRTLLNSGIPLSDGIRIASWNGIQDNSMLDTLTENDISFNNDVDIDPYNLLPTWLHPRKAS